MTNNASYYLISYLNLPFCQMSRIRIHSFIWWVVVKETQKCQNLCVDSLKTVSRMYKASYVSICFIANEGVRGLVVVSGAWIGSLPTVLCRMFLPVKAPEYCTPVVWALNYFYPRPVLAIGYCRCLRLSVCVSVRVRQPSACPRDNSSSVQARITKFGP